jgi:hypothetical protein
MRRPGRRTRAESGGANLINASEPVLEVMGAVPPALDGCFQRDLSGHLSSSSTKPDSAKVRCNPAPNVRFGDVEYGGVLVN